MAWTKIDDQFYMSLKNSLMDRDEQDLYLAGIVYCNGQLSDGFIPASKLTMLCAWAKLPNEANAQAIASHLIEHGFWELANNGYTVHDFLDWNPSKAEVLALRDARSEAGKRGGKRSGATREAKAQASAQAKQKQSATPYPVPFLVVNDNQGNDLESVDDSARAETLTPGPVVARASVTRTTGTKPNPNLSPQVNLFAKVTGFYPARSVHHIVDAAIDTRNDEALLRQCYEAWLLRGFRKENLAWLTEWYTSGGVPTIQRSNGNNGSSHTRADTRDGYNVPAGYEGLVNTDVARTVAAPDPWRDLLAEADTLAPMVRETPQVKERTLRQLTRKLDGILAALPLPYDAALTALGERLA